MEVVSGIAWAILFVARAERYCDVCHLSVASQTFENYSNLIAGSTAKAKACTTSFREMARKPLSFQSTATKSSRSTLSKSKPRSGRSNGKVTTKTKRDSLNPFDPSVWRRALDLAAQYQLVIVPDRDVGYFGRTIEMPYAMSEGSTIEACAANTLEATANGIAAMLESGARPPSPAVQDKREEQLNIRLTTDERVRLDEAARQAGFRSVSDFIRTAALDRSRRGSD